MASERILEEKKQIVSEIVDKIKNNPTPIPTKIIIKSSKKDKY